MLLSLSAVESQAAVFELSDDEAALLGALGRELAATNSWWGDKAENNERSVISVERLGGGRHRVIFRDVIGFLRLPSRQIHIEPKIPLRHFLYIATRSELSPRLTQAEVSVDKGEGFLEAIARWFLSAAETLLRAGLRTDYEELTDELSEVRGRLATCETALCVLSGRPLAVCEFEELSEDTPLNRLVRGACERLAGLDILSTATRTRARKLTYRMDGVSRVRLTDMRVRVDRLSQSYSRAIPLARLILSGCGISSSAGTLVGTAFLVRTPELIEDGLRRILSEYLPGIAVAKRKLFLGDTGLSMNPDLVFGTQVAVGDVKYRYLARDWNRPDLNQVITFATAFQCSACLVLGFTSDTGAALPRAISVGSVAATSLAWVAAEDIAPSASAALLGAQVKQWFERC